jgi:hypothetical protein
MFGSDPSEPLNVEGRKEESAQPKEESVRPKEEQVVPLNAAISLAASTTIVQIDMREAIVFLIVLAVVIYLMIVFVRSAKTLSR